MSTLTFEMNDAHIPVLGPELVELLDPRPGERVVDCTFGVGGHTGLVAERIGSEGELICIDRDAEAAQRFEVLAPDLDCQARFEHGDFADVLEGMLAGGERFGCALMDLGISSAQLDAPERGFSYASDAPLDMRMDASQELSALEVVNDWPSDRLAGAIRDHGEERHARSIAREIERRRPLGTTAELVDAVRAAVPASYRFGRGHPAKRTFQAIRIAVNGELESLDRALPAAWDSLEVGGRLAAISFHSLEDRRVKRFLAERARECICPPELPVCRCGRQPEGALLARRAVSPSTEESERNPRSRSAHLRAARKLTERRDDRPVGSS